MPPLWSGQRRQLLVLLTLVAVLQAFAALIMALCVDAILSHDVVTDAWDLTALAGTAIGIGLARWLERVLGERLGQDYVYEQRRRLVVAAVGESDYSGSLGVTVTRASNDLTSVRNWISLGIVPLVTGIPLIVVVLAGLLALNTALGLSVIAPLTMALVAIPGLAAATFDKSRALRRQRGRMAARIADTVLAGESVRASGAIARELNQLDRHSERVVNAAVDRAWVTGITRALTATAASLSIVAVVFVADLGFVDAATVASAMTLLGVLAAPVGDLGRVVEYRQNYNAASRILAPLLAQADRLKALEEERKLHWSQRVDEPRLSDGHVIVDRLVAGQTRVPTLAAREGTVVRVRSADPVRVREVISALLAVSDEGSVVINGHDVALAPEKARRELIGFASAHTHLERGSVKRLLTYRNPNASDEDVAALLKSVGLRETVLDDEKGLRRQLKNDGSPYKASDVARLKLGRAVLGTPPLLVLEDIDQRLPHYDRSHLAKFIADYPGVVIMSAAHAEILPADAVTWDVDGTKVAGKTSGSRVGAVDLEDDD